MRIEIRKGRSGHSARLKPRRRLWRRLRFAVWIMLAILGVVGVGYRAWCAGWFQFDPGAPVEVVQEQPVDPDDPVAEFLAARYAAWHDVKPAFYALLLVIAGGGLLVILALIYGIRKYEPPAKAPAEIDFEAIRSRVAEHKSRNQS